MVEPRQRAIVHLDADAFFASVEQAADARLRGKPVAVGGQKRGIIASASYEARKFGIYTPMPTALARRLCPRLVLLPGDFGKYEAACRKLWILKEAFGRRGLGLLRSLGAAASTCTRST